MRLAAILSPLLAACGPEVPVDTTAPDGEQVLAYVSVLDGVADMDAYGVFQIRGDEGERPWLIRFRRDWFRTENTVAPALDQEGCVAWHPSQPNARAELEKLLERQVTVGDEEAQLEEAQLGGWADNWAAGVGRDAEPGEPIHLQPDDAPLGFVPGPPADLTLATVNPTAAEGEAWQVARWTPADDGARVQVEIGDPDTGTTIVCQLDDDGYALLPMVPEDIVWQFRGSRFASVPFKARLVGRGLLFAQSEVVMPPRADP